MSVCLGACFILHYSIVSLYYSIALCEALGTFMDLCHTIYKYHSNGLIDNDDCFVPVL